MDAVSVTIILLAPLISSRVSFQFADNILVRLIFVAYVVYGIRLGPLSGLLALLAVFTIILERNHEIMTKLPAQMPRWPTAGQAGAPMKATPLTPVTETVSYDFGNDEKGHSVVETHGESTTEKMYESADDLVDSQSRIPEGPETSDEATAFFTSRSLA